jgi:hypothetical protein
LEILTIGAIISRIFRFLIVFFLILFINSSCFNAKCFKNDNHFELNQAYKQAWTAGIEKGGSGIDYSFELIIKTNQHILFDSVWMNNMGFKLITTKRRKIISNAPITFVKGDTILLKTAESKKDQNNELYTSPPIEYNGDALIGYYLQNKRRYIVVRNIETRSPVYYQ